MEEIGGRHGGGAGIRAYRCTRFGGRSSPAPEWFGGRGRLNKQRIWAERPNKKQLLPLFFSINYYLQNYFLKVTL